MKNYFKFPIHFLSAILLLISPLYALADYTLSGYVRDKETGEELIGASVYIPGKGTQTNPYGYYVLELPEGKHEISVSYIGYATQKIEVDMTENIVRDIDIEPIATQLEEVIIVSGERKINVMKEPVMGVERLKLAQVQSIPVILGELDIMKVTQMLPGVMAANEGSNSLVVRGGGPEQNLVLLDEAPVYNSSHVMGMFSVFNGYAVKDFSIYKGSPPPRFGGRLSSVLDIVMKNGNDQSYHGEASIGVIASKFAFEGPIKKNQGSFIITGRRTYADLFLLLSDDPLIRDIRLYFYDFNMKANYRFGDKDRIYLSGYFGQDRYKFRDIFDLSYGNETLTLRWNHLFSPRLFSNMSLIYSNYRFTITQNFAGSSIQITSGIRDFQLKYDYSWYLNNKHTIRYGLNANYHLFNPASVKGRVFENPIDQEIYLNAVETALYAEHEWKFGDFTTLYGARLSRLDVLSPIATYLYDRNENKTDSIVIEDPYQHAYSYMKIEPRAATTWNFRPKQSFKAAYARNVQYLHLFAPGIPGTALEYWLPASLSIKPGIADQFSMGYFLDFGQGDMFSFSTEIYYKWLQNQIEPKVGANVFDIENIEKNLVFGTGEAYGIELMLKKNQGKLTGWLAYTLARALRSFPDIENGKAFPYIFDRTHDLSAVVTYKFAKNWDASATFIYSTGRAATYPVGRYTYKKTIYPYYASRNSSREPDYHRLDIGITHHKQWKRWKGVSSSLNLSIYNVYNRLNPWTIRFTQDDKDPDVTKAIKTSLFPIIPSLTYNIKF